MVMRIRVVKKGLNNTKHWWLFFYVLASATCRPWFLVLVHLSFFISKNSQRLIPQQETIFIQLTDYRKIQVSLDEFPLIGKYKTCLSTSWRPLLTNLIKCPQLWIRIRVNVYCFPYMRKVNALNISDTNIVDEKFLYNIALPAFHVEII